MPFDAIQHLDIFVDIRCGHSRSTVYITLKKQSQAKGTLDPMKHDVRAWNRLKQGPVNATLVVTASLMRDTRLPE